MDDELLRRVAEDMFGWPTRVMDSPAEDDALFVLPEYASNWTKAVAAITMNPVLDDLDRRGLRHHYSRNPRADYPYQWKVEHHERRKLCVGRSEGCRLEALCRAALEAVEEA